VILPKGDTPLQENDRILMIGSSNARSRIAEQLAPLGASESQPSASSSVGAKSVRVRLKQRSFVSVGGSTRLTTVILCF